MIVISFIYLPSFLGRFTFYATSRYLDQRTGSTCHQCIAPKDLKKRFGGLSM
jgi:hypothetical protein